tara:strand:+ start:3766 stop:4086 length:321 start_codon:yes stop_codon:yes gene_type:complete
MRESDDYHQSLLYKLAKRKEMRTMDDYYRLVLSTTHWYEMQRVNPHLFQVTFVENGDKRYVGYMARKTTRGWELFSDLSDAGPSYVVPNRATLIPLNTPDYTKEEE